MSNKHGRRALVENRDNGGRTTMWEDLLEVFEAEYRFIKWVEAETVEAKPAAVDIHQLNKTSLIEEARKLGIKVSDRMTVVKLKEAILDFKAINEEDKDPKDNLDEI
jgi:hypothetical protein